MAGLGQREMPVSLEAKLVLVAHQVEHFLETRDALFAWAAVSLCTEYGLDYPPEIRAYLASVADDLKKISLDGKRTAKDSPMKVMRALQLTSGALSDFAGYESRREICVEIAKHIILHNKPIKAAIDIVKKELCVSQTHITESLKIVFPGRQGGQPWGEYLKAACDQNSPHYLLELDALVHKTP